MNNLALPEVFPSNLMEDQETLISFMRGDNNIEIYTSDNTTLTKLKRFVKKYPTYKVKEVVYSRDGDPVAVTVIAPLNALTFKEGGKKELTPEEKEAISTRLIASRKK